MNAKLTQNNLMNELQIKIQVSLEYEKFKRFKTRFPYFSKTSETSQKREFAFKVT